jgi:excisionase family DNA binding protein
MMEQLIDIAELERRTAIKQATLRKYVLQRKIPFVKIGRLVRFDLPEIEAWIAERKVPVLKRGEIQQGKQESGQLNFQAIPEIVHFDRFFPANWQGQWHIWLTGTGRAGLQKGRYPGK